MEVQIHKIRTGLMGMLDGVFLFLKIRKPDIILYGATVTDINSSVEDYDGKIVMNITYTNFTD